MDGETDTVRIESEALRKEGYLVEAAFPGEEALRKARRAPYDLVLADLSLPCMHDGSLLRGFQELDHTIPMIVCCREAEIAQALEAIERGAHDYLIKPFHVPCLLLKVRNALEQKRLHRMVDLLDERVRGRVRSGRLVGSSLGMQSVYQHIGQAAAMQAHVLVIGEPGAGKNVTAMEIHESGPRRGMPLFMVGAEQLSERFRPADSDNPGQEGVSTPSESLTRVFSAMTGSTVVLQEISHLSPEIQRVLLALLEQADTAPSGSSMASENDVRIISTTSVDLDKAMQEGTLLPELYQHIGAFQIRIPPLRERLEDLQLLVCHFLEAESRETGKPISRLSPQGLEILSGHDWPGNVAELENLVRRLAAGSLHRVIGPREIQADGHALTRRSQVKTLEDYENEYVQSVLLMVAGNRGKAAKLLGVPRSSFYRRFRKT